MNSRSQSLLRFCLVAVVLTTSALAFAAGNTCRQVYSFGKNLNSISYLKDKNMHVVQYENANKYRFDIGVSLYQEALRILPNAKTILEVGPGKGDVAFQALTSLGKAETSLYFVEPDLASAEILKSRFVKTSVVVSTLEKSLLSKQIPNAVDIVVANFSLHWVDGVLNILNQLNKQMSENGVIALANTDSTRSFWGEIDSLVRIQFPGCSLFNIQQSHSLSAKDWEQLVENAGFKVLSKVEYYGTASLLPSPDAAFAEFKKMTGSRYLLLVNGSTQEQIEKFVFDELLKRSNSNGQVEFKASGYRLVAQKK